MVSIELVMRSTTESSEMMGVVEAATALDRPARTIVGIFMWCLGDVFILLDGGCGKTKDYTSFTGH